MHADQIAILQMELGRVACDFSVLGTDERSRAARFVFERDRRRYMIAHALVRTALGRLLFRDPAGLRFTTGRHGKPALANSDADLRFNLSHSGERALLAVAVGREVGIDIEEHRPRECLDLAKMVFSPREYAALISYPERERIDAFYRGWTRKESFIKARGDGLSFPLAGFDVSLEMNPTQGLLSCDAAPTENDKWNVVGLAADTGYSAAVTVEGTRWTIDVQDVV